MNINTDNINVDRPKLVNGLFRNGYIICFPSTGDVVANHTGKQKPDGDAPQGYKRLNKVDVAGRKLKEVYWELKKLYPECRIHVVGMAYCTFKVNYEQLRLAMEFLQNFKLYPPAFWPSSKYRPDNRIVRAGASSGYLSYWDSVEENK